MKKRKFKTICWSLTFIAVCAFITGALFWYYRAPASHERPVQLSDMSFEHTKYGDYLVGFMARQKQDYAKMSSSFERALTADPNNEKLKLTVYLLRAVHGDMAKVLPLARELNTLKQPELLTDYVLIADAFRRAQYDEAATLLKNKPAYGADQILKPVLKAWLLAGQGQKKAAIQELKKINTTQAQPLYPYYRALMAIFFQDDKTADSLFRKISQKKETDPYPSLMTMVAIRDFYRARGEWKEGFFPHDQMEAFLRHSPAVRGILDHVPTVSALTPAIGAAVAFYDVSVALAPLKIEETSLLLNELSLYLMPQAVLPKVWGGELMENAGNYRSANRAYDRIQPPNDIIILKKIVNLIALEEYTAAHALLKDLLSRNPNEGHLYSLSGQVLLQMQSLEEAAVAYETAIKLFKNSGQNTDAGHSLLALAAVYDQLGQQDKAEKNLLEAIRLIPNEAQALNYLGYLWLDSRKNIDQAFALVEKAHQLQPEDPNIMDSLALGYFLKGEYKTALPYAEKSTDLLSYSSIAYAHLGDIYAALGRNREAAYQYRKALDLTADITPALKEELQKKLGLTR